MENIAVEIGNKRILIVDDTESIHKDFKKILLNDNDGEDNSLYELENVLFQDTSAPVLPINQNGLGYIIDDAYQGEDAVQMVINAEEKEAQYALIFMDVRMPPGISGIEAIKAIWKINPDIEVVICTAYSDYSWEEIVNRVGSTDHLLFLKKPFYSVEVKQLALSLIIKRNLNEKVRKLICNLEGEVFERTQQLQVVLEALKTSNAALEEKNQKLAEIVERDSLTGLYNHTAIHRRLGEVVDEQRRQNIPLSVMMIDVDEFKHFNDTYGHAVGDEILKKIAEVIMNDIQPEAQARIGDEKLKCELRKYDVSGRYGGDEFVIVLPYCGVEDAKKVAERLLNRVNAIRFPIYPDIDITMSVGIASVSSEHPCRDCKELMDMADKALYISKSQGRACYSVANYQ